MYTCLFILTTEQRPKLSELQLKVLSDPGTCSKWESVGIELKLADNDDGIFLEEVAEKFSEDDKRLLQVFKKWLRSAHLNPSWGHLLETLHNLKLNGSVKKVEDYLGKVFYNQTANGPKSGHYTASTYKPTLYS